VFELYDVCAYSRKDKSDQILPIFTQICISERIIGPHTYSVPCTVARTCIVHLFSVLHICTSGHVDCTARSPQIPPDPDQGRRWHKLRSRREERSLLVVVVVIFPALGTALVYPHSGLRLIFARGFLAFRV
jgi:hypothetical protein